jgi:hypothetical protein
MLAMTLGLALRFPLARNPDSEGMRRHVEGISGTEYDLDYFRVVYR